MSVSFCLSKNIGVELLEGHLLSSQCRVVVFFDWEGGGKEREERKGKKERKLNEKKGRKKRKERKRE